MVALNVVGRFRHQNDLHSYRRRLANEVEQDFALRLLPELISLPIDIVDAAGSPQSLADMFRSGRHITLSGPSGGGRRLALQQWALQWAAGDLPGGPTPTILALARLDDGVSPPDQLLSAFIRAATPSLDWGSEWYQNRAAAFLSFMRGDLYRVRPELPSHARLFFTTAEQTLLGEALAGFTDETLSGRLAIPLSAVKARWSRIQDRVARTAPELFKDVPVAPDRLGRGVQTRHLILQYVRDHPSELTPYARRTVPIRWPASAARSGALTPNG